jgi:hypothetical protein
VSQKGMSVSMNEKLHVSALLEGAFRLEVQRSCVQRVASLCVTISHGSVVSEAK